MSVSKTLQQWNEVVRKEGTSGDQVFDILRDWQHDEIEMTKNGATRENDLLKACKELREVSAICFRVFANIHSREVHHQLDRELKAAGIRDGFGVRAQQVIDDTLKKRD